jgi:hypothetical protein
MVLLVILLLCLRNGCDRQARRQSDGRKEKASFHGKLLLS